MHRLVTSLPPAILWATVIALLIGLAVAQAWRSVDAQTPSNAAQPEATATRQAELEELSRLRTQVAQAQAASSPAATPMEAPLASPVATGQPLSDQGGWTIVATSIATITTPIQDQEATGVYMAVFLTITNNTASERPFPWEELVLLDAQGRLFLPHQFATYQIENGIGFDQFRPSLPNETVIVFDVTEDATGPFILESTADPTFRVRMELELRGKIDDSTLQ